MLPQLIGGGIGAVQGGMQGGLKGALIGGGLGAAIPWGAGAIGTRLAGTTLGARGMSALAGGLQSGVNPLMTQSYKMAEGPLRTTLQQGAGMLSQGAGLAMSNPGALLSGTYMGLGAPGLGSAARSIQSGAGGLLGAGAQRMNRQGVGAQGDPYGQLPPGTKARMMGPDGNWWYQMDPSGVAAGNRLGRQLGAQTDASVMNTLGNALYGQTERVAKSELARQAAAYQLKANVDMARDMALNSQTAGLNIGQNAAQNMGEAMSNRSMFRYI